MDGVGTSAGDLPLEIATYVLDLLDDVAFDAALESRLFDVDSDVQRLWRKSRTLKKRTLVSRGEFETLRYIHKRRGARFFLQDAALAAGSGDLVLVEWLCSVAQGGFACNMLKHAACGGHLHIIEWAVKRFTFTTKAVDVAIVAASRHGHLPVVQYLCERFGVVGTLSIMGAPLALAVAAYHGRLDCLAYLFSKMDAHDWHWDSGAYAFDPDEDSVRIVEPNDRMYMHAHRYIWGMVDVAYAGGQAEAVRWLVERGVMPGDRLYSALTAVTHAVRCRGTAAVGALVSVLPCGRLGVGDAPCHVRNEQGIKELARVTPPALAASVVAALGLPTLCFAGSLGAHDDVETLRSFLAERKYSLDVPVCREAITSGLSMFARRGQVHLVQHLVQTFGSGAYTYICQRDRAATLARTAKRGHTRVVAVLAAIEPDRGVLLFALAAASRAAHDAIVDSLLLADAKHDSQGRLPQARAETLDTRVMLLNAIHGTRTDVVRRVLGAYGICAPNTLFRSIIALGLHRHIGLLVPYCVNGPLRPDIGAWSELLVPHHTLRALERIAAIPE